MGDAPQAKRGRPQKLDERETVGVAMRAYWRADPADVSINSICSLADVSKPALYRVFGSEDGMMRAVLDLYADEVLADIFEILARDMPVKETLGALVHFAAEDPKMQTGCVFYKMRAGKHRLGPMTLERVEEIDAAATAAFTSFLEARREVGDWRGELAAHNAARYLVEQIGLALTQRAAGEDPTQVKQILTLSFSVLQRS